MRVATGAHRANQHHSGAVFYRRERDQNKGLIYLETKLPMKNVDNLVQTLMLIKRHSAN
jgi:hypothetical protein